MASNFTTAAYVREYLLVDGNCASSLTRVTLAQKGDGRSANLRLAQFVRFYDGKVGEACAIMDSLGAVEQLLGHALDFTALPLDQREPSATDKVEA